MSFTFSLESFSLNLLMAMRVASKDVLLVSLSSSVICLASEERFIRSPLRQLFIWGEPKETKFRPKEAATPSDDVPQEDDTPPASEEAPQDDDAKPKRRLVRIRKKLADELGVTGESDTTQADAGESMELGGGIDPAVA